MEALVVNMLDLDQDVGLSSSLFLTVFPLTRNSTPLCLDSSPTSRAVIKVFKSLRGGSL